MKVKFEAELVLGGLVSAVKHVGVDRDLARRLVTPFGRGTQAESGLVRTVVSVEGVECEHFGEV